MAADKHVFLKNGSDLFSRWALERADHTDAVREIGFSAQAIFACSSPAGDASIKLICPTGSQFVSWKRIKTSAVVLAKARTHTAKSIGRAHLVDNCVDDIGLWLWVLDRARVARLSRTTVEDFIRARNDGGLRDGFHFVQPILRIGNASHAHRVDLVSKGEQQ